MVGSRSSNIGGNASDNVITTGDRNRIRSGVNSPRVRVELPDAESVDISEELIQIRSLLKDIGGEHSGKACRAIDDAAEEAQKLEPDKNEVGIALKRAIEYAEKGNTFADEIGKLAPHLTKAVAWLGSSWHSLLAIVGTGS